MYAEQSVTDRWVCLWPDGSTFPDYSLRGVGDPIYTSKSELEAVAACWVNKHGAVIVTWEEAKAIRTMRNM